MQSPIIDLFKLAPKYLNFVLNDTRFWLKNKNQQAEINGSKSLKLREDYSSSFPLKWEDAGQLLKLTGGRQMENHCPTDQVWRDAVFSKSALVVILVLTEEQEDSRLFYFTLVQFQPIILYLGKQENPNYHGWWLYGSRIKINGCGSYSSLT